MPDIEAPTAAPTREAILYPEQAAQSAVSAPALPASLATGPLGAYFDHDKGALDTEKLSAAYTERDAVFT